MGRHGRAHRHRPYPTPPNHAVCHYPIGVILSIAQGWQVQRSLPWVTMQARRLPPWGVVLFPPHCFLMSTHTSGAEMHRALPPPFFEIKKCVYRYDLGVTADDVICFKTSYSFGVTVDDAICFKTSYSFGITVDDVICFKTNYSFGVTADNVIYFKTSYSLGVTVASP